MEKLWKFTDNLGSFESRSGDKIKALYFPLCNETLMSSISPDLHGDIKRGQNSFLLQPVSRIDLTNLKSSRNFWIIIQKDRPSYPLTQQGRPSYPLRRGLRKGLNNKGKIWSAAGVSKDLKQIKKDKFSLEAGLLWHKVTRENKDVGLKSEILSFIPKGIEPVEIMRVTITNISSGKKEFTPISAIPIYARSANNLRDHRHVTSLLQRVALHKFGVIVKPTLVFDEAGHRPNKDIYFVLGVDENSRPPEYIYPTQEMFCSDGGDLEAPLSVLENKLPDKNAQIQGRESMGALRFKKITLQPRGSYSYIILMGISGGGFKVNKIINKFNTLNKVETALRETKDFWVNVSRQINFSTGNTDFDNWLRWVNIQPNLRRIFGCSFLPDFDYGKGGRGWRDLWQDCLGLIPNSPEKVRKLLISNFSGVRMDGSNATIIGKNPGEFIADRNDIARVWMDHGIWPLLALDLYLNETGDFGILLEKATYFRDRHIFRSSEVDRNWKARKIYRGTIIEHLLIQNLVQFFNVGAHNHVRLEGADWNDGLDMAKENGESVAFSAMYAQNLKTLADLLLKIGKRKIEIAKELKILLSEINYNDIKLKQKILNNYFMKTKSSGLGKKIDINIKTISQNLSRKSEWVMSHIRKHEWLKQGFFNGYYDNKKIRVEGRQNNSIRMMLASQVFPIMSGVADRGQVNKILKSIKKYLLDKKLRGYHLNTDFNEEQHNLGWAFSFVYGDKENGSFFNHMIVMFAYALYKRGIADEAWEVLISIYNMAIDTEKSKIYPCLPEYFDFEGRGMYSYLTGSSSWFVLTILTQTFGVRGRDGDLIIEPKLTGEQFKYSSTISIERSFAGRRLQIRFFNPKRLGYAKCRIIKAVLNSSRPILDQPDKIIISRKTLLSLNPDKMHRVEVSLGPK